MRCCMNFQFKCQITQCSKLLWIADESENAMEQIHQPPDEKWIITGLNGLATLNSESQDLLIVYNLVSNKNTNLNKLLQESLRVLKTNGAAIICNFMDTLTTKAIADLSTLFDTYSHTVDQNEKFFKLYCMNQFEDAANQKPGVYWILETFTGNKDDENGEKMNRSFLDTTQYTPENIKAYEWIFGKDFISPGGVDQNRRILSEFDDLSEGKTMLDIGSGIGGSPRQISRELKINVLGVDISANMIAFAMDRETDKRVKFRLADAVDYVFKPNSFDYVYSRDCAQHINELPRLFQNIYNCLKPGGQLIVTMYGKGNGKLSNEFLEYVEDRKYTLRSLEDVVLIAENVGFENVEGQNITKLFEQILQKERKKAIANHDVFMDIFSTKKYNALLDGWEQKLRFIKADNHNWFKIKCSKPIQNELVEQLFLWISVILTKMGSAASSGLLPHPRVETSFGPVEGKRVLMPVPYAKPPVGHLRFKKPEMPEKWTQRVICRRYKARSVQTRTPWDLVDVGFTDEDCLYLNIVGPANFNEKYPNGYATMVYLHGGGFQMDSAAKYHYKHLMRLYCKHDVIMVTVEYRLGYLGFLCLDGKHCKGNFGLWDMLSDQFKAQFRYFALRFVHDNIRLFGGDPDNVCLMGQSAGAVSAALLAISPISRDLFKQTICIAGFAHSVWSVNDIKFAVDTSRKKALSLGFKRSNKDWKDDEIKECIEFLRKLPSSRFGLTMIGERNMLKNLRLRVAPVLDGELFPASIKELIDKASIRNEIVGATAHEGLIFLALLGVRVNRRVICELIESSYKQIQFWANVRGTEMPMTIEAFKNIYGINDIMLNDKKKLKRTAVQMISDFVTNMALHAHCVKSLERNGTRCYRYLFEHYNRMITSAFNAYFPFVSSTHGTELPYLFNANIYISPWYKTKADLQVQDIITRMFANFAKSGDPNGDPTTKEFNFKWEPVSFEKPEAHLVIRAEPFMRESTGHLARIERMSVALDLMML
ncbi:hypothetical protein M3Y97_00110500 [Aphelenchoides bicaudatus]|nr:hypothetical protein M3Y97_00110500 [Aphelenchoides bicaudatus]